MKLGDAVHTAFRALSRNLTRALLTTLGIVIGVAAVIAMMEIGQGSSTAIKKAIASMGANNFMVMPGIASTGGVSFGAGSVMTLTPEDYEAISRDCPAVKAAAPLVNVRSQIVYGGKNWVPNEIQGSTPSLLEVKGLGDLVEGEPFTDRDVAVANRVCLIGRTIVRELFPNESPIGKTIRVKNVAFKVIGVLAPKGANMMGMDQDDTVIAPWTAIKYRVSGVSSTKSNQSDTSSASTLPSQVYPSGQPSLYPAKSSVQQTDTQFSVRFSRIDRILVSAVSADAIPEAIAQVTAVLRSRHRLATGEPDDFNVRDFSEMHKALTSTTTVMKNLLFCVAMISLVVGGVGIMNIMLVSVTERTREIGLRMAIGARARDILVQFLVEAIALCLIGGALGIALGHGGSLLVRAFLRWPVETSPVAIAAAVLVSAAVGLIFGFYPAWKASRLDPIEALRYE